jgi:hypothetical protein
MSSLVMAHSHRVSKTYLVTIHLLKLARCTPCTRGVGVLHFWHMGHTLTIRLTPELAEWLEQASKETGVSQGKIVREQLDALRNRERKGKGFMHLAGSVDVAPDASTKKGFSR